MLRFVKQIVNDFIFKQQEESFVRLYGMLNRSYWKYPFTMKLSPRKKIVISSLGEDNLSLEISKKVRIFRYQKGILPFLQRLVKQYFIDTIEFREGDTVIDCGANIGEVGLWLKTLNKNIAIHAVEPEVAEADACDQNIYDGKPITTRKALWKEQGNLSFYSKNSTGDSSLFEQEGYDKVIVVETTTLENLFIEKNIDHVRLLKLEAEGAEPEILMGAVNVLSKIDYIVVDCGPERGLSMEPTFIPVYNFLITRGFNLVDIKFDRIVALFKRDNV